MSPLLEACALTKTFGVGATRVEAVRGISLSVAPGELLALVGPSGSGKTTLLSLLGGLERPDSGSLRVGGVALETLGEAELADYRRARVGFIFQRCNLLADLTALENIELPMALARLSRGARRDRARELLERLGLSGRAVAFVEELSGGEQQRIAVARAIAHRPLLILADEPTASLDSATARVVVELLDDLRRREQVAIIVATHDQSVAALADRTVRLKDGRVELEV